MNPRTRQHGFTLLELLVVVGLIALLSFFVAGGLAGGGKSAALQSAQSLLANLVTAARTKAVASGRSVRLLVHIDAASTAAPSRFLRYVVLQTPEASGWQTLADAYLPAGVYLIPGNFPSLPAGLFAASPVAPWTRSDGSALRSTALRAASITTEAIGGAPAERWVQFTITAVGTTGQSGDLILAVGKVRPPGSYAAGDSPVELENPEEVRGIALSVYGVPVLVNGRSGF